MATRGYNSYRGRVSTGRIVLIVVLVLVLLGAIGYLAVQNYLVYDEAGQVHLELPWGRRDPQQEQTDKPPVENVDIDRLEPESKLTPVTALHAVRLPDDCLWWGADYIMNTLAPEDMVLAVKRENGGITYDTQVSVPQNVVVERGRPLDCLKQLLASDRYTVARICCFADAAYARGLPETALVREDDSIWYDANGGAWLDPTDPTVLSYITSLVKECASLGFDEVLLDWFCYPAEGQLDAIANGGSDHTQILTDFAKSLRSSLPEGVALSMTLRGSGDNALTVPQLAELFDRIYLPAGEDASAARSQLPDGYDAETRLVVTAVEAPASGSYVIGIGQTQSQARASVTEAAGSLERFASGRAEAPQKGRIEATLRSADAFLHRRDGRPAPSAAYCDHTERSVTIIWIPQKPAPIWRPSERTRA